MKINRGGGGSWKIKRVVKNDDPEKESEPETNKNNESELTEELPEVKVDSEIVAVKDEVVYYEAVPSNPPATTPDHLIRRLRLLLPNPQTCLT